MFVPPFAPPTRGRGHPQPATAMTMDRRQFLRVTAAGALLGLTRADGEDRRVGSGTGANDLAALATPSLLALLDADDVRDIGTRYRAAHPREASAEALRAAILDAYPPPARHWATHVPVAELVRADFEAGRVVVVRGWVLSITEARQCALHSLLSA